MQGVVQSSREPEGGKRNIEIKLRLNLTMQRLVQTEDVG